MPARSRASAIVGSVFLGLVGMAVIGLGALALYSRLGNEPAVTVQPPEQEQSFSGALVANGSPSPQPASLAATAAAAQIKDFKFVPTPLNVGPGAAVTWTQRDAIAHTVTSGKPGDSNAGSQFDKSLNNIGDTYTVTFSQAGSFEYFCRYHPYMLGNVVAGQTSAAAVTPAPSATPQAFTQIPASQVQPPPTGAQLVAAGLQDPRGFTWGPDGALYVAEAGAPTFTAVAGTEAGANILFCEGWQQTKPGSAPPPQCPQIEPVYTVAGRISRIAADGTRQTVVENLPVVVGMFGFSEGPASVAFVGNDLYVLILHTTDNNKPDGLNTGVYKVNPGGSGTLVAALDVYNLENQSRRKQIPPDYDVSEVYDMVSLGGKLYVSDANAGVVFEVDPAKPRSDNTRYIADLSEGHPVLTGIAAGPDGNLYVTDLTKAPYPPGGSRVWRIVPSSGAITEVVTNSFTIAVGVAVGPDGSIYASEFGSIGSAPPFVVPGGRIMRWRAGGEVTAVSTSVFYPTIIRMGPDGLYTTYFSIGTQAGASPGAIYKLPISALR